MFHLEQADTITISQSLVRIFVAIFLLFVIYLFSYNIQVYIAKILTFLRKKLGLTTLNLDYKMQRYCYEHNRALITRLYHWVNKQLIALNIKQLGVNPIGYLFFWGFASIVAGILIGIIVKFGALTIILCVLIFILCLVLTRTLVSARIEAYEQDVMDAMDLIIPEAGNGIKNAITAYIDNLPDSIQGHFRIFLTNVNELGYSFEDAMFILTDNLGEIFRDFAQKAIYFEQTGEKDTLEIFTDITETNRLRRQLRDENNDAFKSLKTSFIVSVLMTAGYFCFICVTDEFSRNFFLMTTGGKMLLLFMLGIVFAVLSYITTIKSRAL